MHFKLLVKDGALQEAIAEGCPTEWGGEYLRKLRGGNQLRKRTADALRSIDAGTQTVLTA